MATHKKVIEAICAGLHHDPFSVLGRHISGKGAKATTRFSAFFPGAEKVSLVAEKPVSHRALACLDEAGFFELELEKAFKADYKYEVVYANGFTSVVEDVYRFSPSISAFDLHLWGEGNFIRAYDLLGAHLVELEGVQGVRFVVSAPSASKVSVVGPFNQWDGRCHIMRKYHDQGLWELFIPGLSAGDVYKYELKSPYGGIPFLKADPYAVYAEKRPKTASIVYDLAGYSWSDEAWLANRQAKQGLDKPISIYEVHLGSWRRKLETEDGFLSYRELAHTLIPYVKELGYTHVELLPIAEHPYDPSWGYQITGYFAPTSRFGSPHDFMYFVDECHRQDIGVIVDWVPAHFTKDDHGLRMFDGTHLYEHADPRQGEHKDWGTNIFNFGRTEVMNFLVSNAVYWFDKFHIDGLRVDAVASMLYLDYSRKEGEWVPNRFGGRENLEAIHFLKRFNEVVHAEFPGAVTFAEESTAWPMVSKPTYLGGLGFDFKWNMGWMNDTLKYIEVDPLFRRYHQNQLTFSFIYAFSEQFVLPFSHDEVVHMKKAMVNKMPGDDWQKMANLRALYAYMYAHPGKKLLFMGSEFGQWQEWNSQSSLDWHLLESPRHRGVQQVVSDLNATYKAHPALFEVDYNWEGFEWIDFSDVDNSIVVFMRHSKNKKETLICAFNFTPMVHQQYRIGVPEAGTYTEIFNSDHARYGGSNVLNGEHHSAPGKWHNRDQHITISIPPLAGVMFKKLS